MDNLNEYDGILSELRPKCEVKASPELTEKIMRAAKTRKSKKRRPMIAFWGSVAGVAAVVALMLYVPTVSAKELLGAAVNTLNSVRSMVMEVEVRTLPRENFAYIDLQKDFVPHKISASYSNNGTVWRVDKSGRIACGNDQTVCLWLPETGMGWGYDSGNDNVLEFFKMLVTPQLILEKEYEKSLAYENDGYKVERKGGELLLTVHAYPHGDDYNNPYMLNASIEDSENIRRYVFDAKSRRLKGLSIAVVSNGEEVEVLRTTSIVFDEPLKDSELLAVSPGVSIEWNYALKGILAGATAKEVATKILSSFKDWNSREFDFDALCSKEEQSAYKDVYAGSVLLSVGEPFHSGTSGATFVPYKLRLSDGRIVELNLALLQQEDSTWIVTGGL